MAKRFLVLAYVRGGESKINIIHAECPTERWAGMAAKHPAAKKSDDWQASSYDTHAAAVSGIIADYGLGWFNRARGRLAEFA